MCFAMNSKHLSDDKAGYKPTAKSCGLVLGMQVRATWSHYCCHCNLASAILHAISFLCDSQLRLLPPRLVALRFPSAPYHKFRFKVASKRKAAIRFLFLTTTWILRGTVVRPRWPSGRITTCRAAPLDKKSNFQ